MSCVRAALFLALSSTVMAAINTKDVVYRRPAGGAGESGEEKAWERRREDRAAPPVSRVHVARRSARRETRGKVHREHHR